MDNGKRVEGMFIHSSRNPHNRYGDRIGRDKPPRFRDPRTLEDVRVSKSEVARSRLYRTIVGIPRPSWRQRRTFVFGLRWGTWSTLSTSLRLRGRSHDAFVVALADGHSLGAFGIFVDVGSLCDSGRGGNLFTTSRIRTRLGRHGGRDLIFFGGHLVNRKGG